MEEIFLITTTIRRMPKENLREAIEEALKKRGQGFRSEILFTTRAAEHYGLNQPMQDLREMAADFGIDFDTEIRKVM